MRMSQESTSIRAWDLVNWSSQSFLQKIFSEYGEDPYSRSIADAIIKYRKGKLIDSTRELASIIEAAIPRQGFQKSHYTHPATRVFQALRIAVNSELEEIHSGIQQAFDKLGAGGLIIVVSFNSLEDQIVKKALVKLNEGRLSILLFKRLFLR